MISITVISQSRKVEECLWSTCKVNDRIPTGDNHCSYLLQEQMQTSEFYRQALGGESETHGSNKQRVFIVN